jgi:hypothetical protein
LKYNKCINIYEWEGDWSLDKIIITRLNSKFTK